MRIRKVTDMRTGLVHPKRDAKGRFIPAEVATIHVDMADIWARAGGDPFINYRGYLAKVQVPHRLRTLR